jgi:protease IV
VKNFVITIAGVFVGLLLFVVVLPLILIMGAVAASGPPATPSKSVLVLDLRGALSDQPSLSPLAALTGSGATSVIEIVRKLEMAEADPAVEGLLVRAPEAGLAPAHAEEVRQALIDFRASGKFVIAHAQNFQGPSITSYVAISAADEVWLQPASDFGATGIAAESVFLGGLMERFGIIPQFEQLYEYKSFAETYTTRDFSGPNREATESLLGSVYNAALASLAFDRKIPVEQLKALLDTAPLAPQAARTAKLIDQIGMPEDAADAALKRAGTDDPGRLIDLGAYIPSEGRGPMIAVVGGEGAILTGTPSADPLSGEAVMSGDLIAAAIREATDDDSIDAIVLRVSSPGGSPVASEQIWAAVARAKTAGKPVVVSMGAYAASGGYYVAANADRIFALPSTITGSIGVVGGKLAVNDALNRYTGANIAAVTAGGPNTTALSPAEPFSNSQRAAYRASLERTYADFTGKVADGRNLPLPRVQAIARGRVWSGAQARNLKLVDEIGGLRVAVRAAGRLAGKEVDDGVRIRIYPQAGSPVEALASLLGVTASGLRGAAVLGALSSGDFRAAQGILTGSHSRDGHRQMIEALRVH